MPEMSLEVNIHIWNISYYPPLSVRGHENVPVELAFVLI